MGSTCDNSGLVNVHVIDGTYELFRHFFAVPSALSEDGHEVGALRGVLGSVLGMIEAGATHLGVATDHVIESFRNEMYDGYKTGTGIDPALQSQFTPLEDGLRAMGVVVWPMIHQEADDAMAAAAVRAAANPDVSRVFVCTPDKDLAQCVVGDRIVQLDRRKNMVRDADGVREKFGVAPESIPDFLGLVGDSADGFPGLRGWGARSTAAVLAHYEHLEAIPRSSDDWDVSVRSARKLAATLVECWEDALLYRDLATLRTDAKVFDSVDELRWRGPQADFEQFAKRIRAPGFWSRASSAVAR